MAAFERVKSGIPAMDRVLDNIRMGDNVVWRVSDLKEFHYFLDPYIKLVESADTATPGGGVFFSG